MRLPAWLPWAAPLPFPEQDHAMTSTDIEGSLCRVLREHVLAEVHAQLTRVGIQAVLFKGTALVAAPVHALLLACMHRRGSINAS
jgi:hypothetical protein